MSIRLRTLAGVRVALCAARSIPMPGDLHLDDADHHALAEKFAEDFTSEGTCVRSVDPVAAALRAREEDNNSNRDWWNGVYAAPRPVDAHLGAVGGE